MKKTIMLAVAACVLTIFWISSVFAENAATNFKKICSPCHGEKGEGKKLLCPSLRDSQFVAIAPAADIKNTILNGRMGKEKRYPDYRSPMPAQKGKLQSDEIEALVKYLKKVIHKKK